MRSRHFIGLLAALAGAALLSGCQPPQPKAAAPEAAPLPEYEGKLLLMHYMPWYKTPEVRGSWGPHWTGFERQHNPEVIEDDGFPDIYSHYHPRIGLYDSTDRDVLECQLLQMKLAGVDGVIADWYGIAGSADFPEIHEATKALFDTARQVGMTFSVCYEDRTLQMKVDWGELAAAEVTNHLVETMAWLQDNWFEAPHYQHMRGRPLLLNFGPIYLQHPEVWNAALSPLPVRPLFFALHHLWRQAGADGGFTWVHYDPWDGDLSPETIRRRIGEVFRYFSNNPDEVMVSAYPGFNDIYPAERHRELDHRGGATLRETLEVGMAGPWEAIQLVTWNDYGEGTIIEPTHEFGYTFLEIVQDARKAEQGEGFTFTHDDLRLPARLLALRRAGNADPAALNAVAGDLARGLTGAARAALDKLDGGVSAP